MAPPPTMAASTKSSIPSGSVIFRPEKASFLDLLSFAFLRRSVSSYKFVESSGTAALDLEGVSADSITALVLIVQKILAAADTPMKWMGWIVEFFLNLFALNGGILWTIWRMLTCRMVMPKRGAANYRSILAHIDDRVTLYKRNSAPAVNFIPFMDSQSQFGDLDLLDISTMAAKIAYENEAFIKDTVINHWKMNFVGFFDCWNKFLNRNTTQAFIFSNKAEDADLIVLAFRGTELFNAIDWSTDIDLSRLSMGKLGFLHLGFLKALGLQDENDFLKGFPKEFTSNAGQPVAYYTIREALRTLLKKHTNAKILVTGHSLGGALAIIFPSLLAMHDQDDILKSTYGVATYGQPRVGDAEFGSYVEVLMRLNYHRMVYRYDIVPRIPFDMAPVSLFKHCGTCIYYNGWYKGQVMGEVPNPNYFDPKYVISMYMNAMGDMFKGMFMGVTQGKDYKESAISILYRACGLILPGIASHSPRDYVNGGRLAKITNKVMV